MGIEEKFNHLKKIISSRDFLSGRVLCNDLPIFIADYDISEEKDFLIMEKNLIKTLESMEIKVLSIDLYDLVIEILKKIKAIGIGLCLWIEIKKNYWRN